MEHVLESGYGLSACFLVGLLLLHAVVPGVAFEGYVKDAAGRPLRYNLNGVRVYAIVMALVAWRRDVVLATVYRDYLQCLVFSFCAGLAGSVYYYLRGPFAKEVHVCAPKLLRKEAQPRSRLNQFFFGYELNPRVVLPHPLPPWDVKMFLYLYGAVLLQILILANCHHQAVTRADGATPGMLLHAAEFSYFIFEYLWNEDVHTLTYDFMDENGGSFKLVWGCLCFYPFFYALGSAVLAAAAPAAADVSSQQLVVSLVVFAIGAVLSRGANNQKFYFKREPSRKAIYFGLVEQRAINGRILCSGFWGVSRHINYLGELFYALGLALCAPLPPAWPATLAYSYALYYVLLLVPRERDDDERCHAKYGKDWEEYRRLVPYRIVPYLY